MSKWILGVTDIDNKCTSAVEMQNLPKLLKLIEGMNPLAIIQIFYCKPIAS